MLKLTTHMLASKKGRGDVRAVVAFRTTEEHPIELRTVPHGSIVLSIQFGPAMGSDEGGAITWCKDAFTGLRRGPTTYIVQPGTQMIVALLSPRGASALLGGMPLQHCAGVRIPLHSLLSEALHRELRQRVATPDRAGAQALESWLRRRIEEGSARLPSAAERTFALADWSHRQPSTVCLDAIEKQGEVSRRQCERDFVRWLGMNPKHFVELRRMQRALSLIRSGAALVSCAARQGYSDQAHMTRALRRLTGSTPGEWARRNLSSIGSDYLSRTGDEFITE